MKQFKYTGYQSGKVVADLRKKGEELMKNFTRAEYDAYLNGPEWAEKRRKRLVIDGNRCRMCGKTADETRLECHHVNYRTFAEEDVYADLITLCPKCHRAVHRMMCRPTGTWEDGSVRFGWQTDLPHCIRDDLRQRGLM